MDLQHTLELTPQNLRRDELTSAASFLRAIVHGHLQTDETFRPKTVFQKAAFKVAPSHFIENSSSFLLWERVPMRLKTPTFCSVCWAACDKYYGIGLVVEKRVYVKTAKARLYCLQCCLIANERVLHVRPFFQRYMQNLH